MWFVDDCDWYLASSRAELIESYRKDTGISLDDPSETYEILEVEDAALDRLQFTDGEERDAPRRSFRDQLAIELRLDPRTPRLFASTEY